MVEALQADVHFYYGLAMQLGASQVGGADGGF
jgi:hypothetical protein